MLRDRLFYLIFFCFAAGCQSTSHVNLVRERAEKLKPLSTFRPAWCRVEARLTQPAAARYKEIFPDESDRLEALTFTWKARETFCEVTPLDRTPVSANYGAFVESAMCLLMQVHWVNSPFDELKIAPDTVEQRDGSVRLRTGGGTDPDLGIFVEKEAFVVETRTKSRGRLRAEYVEMEGEWLPAKLSQDLNGKKFTVAEFDWAADKLSGRRMPKSLWISVGEETAFRHSELVFHDCQNY
ncbi:MAG: hypothetical protein HC902_12975 [Calothrix sp. SM1_5_4]|nr:hypothetical protein [Calothrix sp. SM1_5_4]